MHFLQAINSDISVLLVCNKTGCTIKGDIKKIRQHASILIASDSVQPLLHEQVTISPRLVLQLQDAIICRLASYKLLSY